MEREIKFRLINSMTGEVIGYEELDEYGNFFWYYSDYDGQTFGSGSFDVAYMGDGFTGKIIREQFTGLQDCDGKDTYEGDIIKPFDDKQGTVIFKNGNFINETSGWSLETYIGHSMFHGGTDKRWKILGNIHEYFELINK